MGADGPQPMLARLAVAVLRGQLGQAVAYNPASPLLVAGAVLFVRWLVGRLTGRWLHATLRPTPLAVGFAALLR